MVFKHTPDIIEKLNTYLFVTDGTDSCMDIVIKITRLQGVVLHHFFNYIVFKEQINHFILRSQVVNCRKNNCF